MLGGGKGASGGHSFPSRPTRLVPRGSFGLTVPADSEAINQKGEKPRRYSCSGSPAAEAAAVPERWHRAADSSLTWDSLRLAKAGPRGLGFLPVGSAEAAGGPSGLLAVSSPGPKGGGNGAGGSRLGREPEGRKAASGAPPRLPAHPSRSSQEGSAPLGFAFKTSRKVFPGPAIGRPSRRVHERQMQPSPPAPPARRTR